MKKIKVYIADDHPVLRDGIKALFHGHGGFTVVGEADTGTQALKEISSIKPDVVIMDITMPGLSGIEAAKRITEELPKTKVVMLSMHADVYHAIEAFRAGATAYVLKDSAPKELLNAVDKVIAGEKFASPAVAEQLLNDFVDIVKKDRGSDPFDALTAREREVLKHLADGATSREMAEKLFISVATVKSHRNNLMKKLRCNDMAGLIKLAIRKGLVNPE
ncbi:MAG: response regulator transcription factor [Deltaproteobacteria bacterium]